jgi:hypothetical protein
MNDFGALKLAGILSNMTRRVSNSDIYNSAQNVARYKIKLARFNNGKVCEEFLDALLLAGRSWIRIANYAYSCERILLIKDNEYIKTWTRKDCEEIRTKDHHLYYA